MRHLSCFLCLLLVGCCLGKPDVHSKRGMWGIQGLESGINNCAAGMLQHAVSKHGVISSYNHCHPPCCILLLSHNAAEASGHDVCGRNSDRRVYRLQVDPAQTNLSIVVRALQRSIVVVHAGTSWSSRGWGAWNPTPQRA